MNTPVVRTLIGVEYALGTAVFCLAAYLISAPLRSGPDDPHGGTSGLFSGLILLSFSVAIFVAAHAMRRGGRRHWLSQSAVIVLCAGLLAVLLAS